MRNFTLGDFDFALPPELIAQYPAAERGGSRLLDGTGATPVDRGFRDLPSLLRAGDLMVFNDTQVVKARLFGEKPTGGKLELLIERVLQDREVAAHMKVSKRPQPGTVLQMVGGFTATLTGRWPQDDGPLFRFTLSDDPYELMQQHGHVPLPPYITHSDSAEDERRYQTVFAKHPGAVAAPTAALHFDEAMLATLDRQGVRRATVTLHVGAGTFQPVKTENIAEHRMHSERYVVPAATQQALAETRSRGGRQHLHHARLRLQAHRNAAHQLPPAPVHPHDDGQRPRGLRSRHGPLSPRHRAPVPILQLWRRDAADPQPRCLNSNCSRPKASPAADASP